MAVTNLLKKPTKKFSRKKNSEDSSYANNGLIKLDTGNLKLPTQLIEEQGEVDKPFWQIEPALLVLFALAVGFIVFITILISHMPTPSK